MFCLSTSINGIMGGIGYMTLSKATFGVLITSEGLLTSNYSQIIELQKKFIPSTRIDIHLL
jgi:hypothetical protein